MADPDEWCTGRDPCPGAASVARGRSPAARARRQAHGQMITRPLSKPSVACAILGPCRSTWALSTTPIPASASSPNRPCSPSETRHAKRSWLPHAPAASRRRPRVLDRVLARFTPIASWNVIGPFPRVTPRLFIGERSIDFGKTTIGATGRQVAWTNLRGDAASGRVDLDDLIPRDQAPDSSAPSEAPSAGLGAFAYAEVNVEHRSRAALWPARRAPS